MDERLCITHEYYSRKHLQLAGLLAYNQKAQITCNVLLTVFFNTL